MTISSQTLVGLLYDSAEGTLPCVPVSRRRTRVGPDGRNPFIFDQATLADVFDRGLVVRDGEQLRITQLGRATVRASRASIADAAASREKRRLARRRGRCTLCGATWPGRTDEEAHVGHTEHVKTAHPHMTPKDRPMPVLPTADDAHSIAFSIAFGHRAGKLLHSTDQIKDDAVRAQVLADDDGNRRFRDSFGD